MVEYGRIGFGGFIPDKPTQTKRHTSEPQTPAQASPLDDFINSLEGELRTGGGATLDELYNLAIAVREALRASKERTDDE